MLYICECGHDEFEKALRPVTEALTPGKTPPPAEFYYRCVNCWVSKDKALALDAICPTCGKKGFKHDSYAQISSIQPPVPVRRGLSIYQCLSCGHLVGLDYLQEQAKVRALS